MISVQQLSLTLGDFALKDVSFDVPQGEYAVLMGRTGSGKTSILEAICGLKPTTGGKIILDNVDVTTLKPAARGIGFVPQDAAIFPTMTVREQIAFPLTLRKWNKRDIADRLDELAELLAIENIIDRKPMGLSGGEQQRIALGRALASHPPILCMDEPLSAIDEATRDSMYALLKNVQKKTGVTTIHVTHSQHEADNLAQRILMLDNGQVQSSATAS